MKTWNIMASSYHAKVRSTQNQGVPLFSFLGHGVQYYIFKFGAKVKVFPIILACQSYSTFNVCMKTVNEFYVFNGTKWLSVCLRTKWLWNQFLLQLLKFQIQRLSQARSSLTFRQM